MVQLILQMIVKYATPKALMWSAAAIIVTLMIWYLRHTAIESYKAAELQKEYEKHLSEEKRSVSIGMDLNNGTNLYETETRKITDTASPVMDEPVRLRIAQRVKASNAATASVK